jgi:L-alanine-DL-glutamate epimerase-like enolase superfamily enzyme
LLKRGVATLVCKPRTQWFWVPAFAGTTPGHDRSLHHPRIEEGVLTVLQPDAAKWGGITGCLAVARDVVASKRHYCPHYLGGGIGLLASAHLLAGSRGGGLLEVDSNDNPLREHFCGAVADIKDGEIVLPETAGLGIEPDIAQIEKYRTL